MSLPTNLNRFGGGKKAKPYYCEVEYLDATKNTVNSINAPDAAYIDTGIVPDDTTIMEARIQFNILNTNNREQLNGSTAPDARFAFGFGSVTPYTNFYAGLTTQNLVTSIPRDLNPHTFILDALNKTITIDGTTESFTTASSFGETEQSIYLFARNSASYEYANRPMNGKVYYCKITKNGSLVRDMIPVLDFDMKPCMYDRVSGMLFYSIGTGDFVAGRQIHPVEYLGFTGTQYIDTGLHSASNLKVECECSSSTIDGFNNALFGGRESNTVNSFVVWKHLMSNSAPRFDFANNQRFATNEQEADVWYTITKDGADNYVDGVAQTSNTASDFESTTTKIIIGGVRTGTSTFTYSYFQGKIKSAKCWKAGVLKHDFIPAIDEDGVGFMFDKVSHTIYDNAGTGTFTYPDVELEYLTSDGNQYIDTNFIPDSTSGIMLKVALPDVTTDIVRCGCRQANGNSRFIIGDRNGYVYFGFGSLTSNQNDTITENVPFIAKLNYYNDGYSQLDGNEKRNIGDLTGVTFTYSVIIFGRNYYGTIAKSAQTFFACELTRGSALSLSLTPVIHNGTACIYDSVGNNYLTNQGTGTFTYKIKEAK